MIHLAIFCGDYAYAIGRYENQWTKLAALPRHSG